MNTFDAASVHFVPPQINDRLLAWINEHDCGVTPTAIPVPLAPGVIEIRVLCTGPDGDRVQSDFVETYREARDVLGY